MPMIDEEIHFTLKLVSDKYIADFFVLFGPIFTALLLQINVKYSEG